MIHEANQVMLAFIASLGEGVIVWGPKERNAPIPDDEFSVEIDVHTKVRLGQTAAFTDDQAPRFYTRDGTTYICGLVEGRDDDGSFICD